MLNIFITDQTKHTPMDPFIKKYIYSLWFMFCKRKEKTELSFILYCMSLTKESEKIVLIKKIK